MKPFVVLIVLSLATTSVCAREPLDENKVISYAKGLDVAKLDASLPSQRLDKWLRSGPAHIETVQWYMSRDCDLKPPAGQEPKDDWPLCVRFGFQRNGVGGWAMMKVGTLGKGTSGAPHFEYVVVASGGAQPVGRESKKLSDLPRLLDEVASLTKHP
jgi:hypothetical protein